jgi:hypothetical protein
MGTKRARGGGDETRRGAFFAGALCLALLGCDAHKKPAAEEQLASQRAGDRTSSAVTGQGEAQAEAQGTPSRAELPAKAPAEREFRFPAPERLVAIGDLHGDLAATRRVLRLVGATDEEDRWKGGKLVVVQTGDQLDRGDDERAILDLLERLTAEAKAAGGALHVLNGNHETMNVLGDFRYVTPGARAAFDDATPKAAGADRYPRDWRGRAAAFLPGGQFALRLAERDVVVVVGDTVFAHAGVRAPHVDHGLGKLNAETRAWMRGDMAQPPRLIVDPEGPVWTRVYAPEVLDEAACAVLVRALDKVGARRMVVGHNVQADGVQPGCDERVWRIDVGMARHYGGPTEALEIRGDQVRILREK